MKTVERQKFMRQTAWITLAGKSTSVSSVVATRRYPMVLDAIQKSSGEGPCLAAAWERHMMRLADPNSEQRWSRHRRLTLEQAPPFRRAADGYVPFP